MSYQTGDPLGMRLRIAPGADTTADPDTYTWIEITNDLVMDVDITYDDGAADEAQETNSQFTCSLRDNRGRYDPDNAESDLWPNFDLDCPIEWAINLGDGSGWQIQFRGGIAAIAEDYSSGTPHKVRRAITAAGPFRRLGQGKALSSALTRYYRSAKPVRYWRLEDGKDSRVAVSDVAGQPPMILPPNVSAGLPQFASRTGIPGSLPMVQFGPGAQLDVSFTPYVRVGSTLSWVFVGNVGTLTGSVVLARMVVTGSTAFAWEIFVDAGHSPRLRALDSTFNTIFTSTDFAAPPGFVGTGANTSSNKTWYLYTTSLQQSGANIAWVLNFSVIWVDDNGDFASINYVDSGTLTSTQVGQVSGFQLAPIANAEDIAIGHLGLFDSAISTPLIAPGAFVGWPQTVAARVAGVANEFGVPNAVTGSVTAKIGPQQVGTVLDLLRDGPRVDHGILSDSRGVVSYRGLRDLYNLPPTITLDGANREVSLPYAPVRDDQKHRNRVTVSRVGGSSYTRDDVVDQERTALVEGSEQINVASDLQLPDHAGYFLAVGTVRGKRYPQLTLDFLTSPQLARPWLGMRLGDRFLLRNPPRGGAKGDISLQLRGFKQRWSGRYKWTAVCNTIKSDPFNIGVMDDPTYGRAEADSATLAGADLDVATTTFSVATTGPRLIDSATYPTMFPILCNLNGEQISIKTITGTSSPQAVTCDRSLNHVRKIHKVGAPLSLWQDMVVAL